MGSAIKIYRLLKFSSSTGINCEHFLLSRIERPTFGNASDFEYDHVEAVADKRSEAILAVFEDQVLQPICPQHHEKTLIGELQETPLGDDLLSKHGMRWLDVWIAETRFGHPWVVMGMADCEEDFWKQIQKEENDDLSGLEPKPPARKYRVWFMTESDFGP